MKQHASPLAGEAGQPTGWPGEGDRSVIPAQAGIQAMYFFYFLDSRFRGNDTP